MSAKKPTAPIVVVLAVAFAATGYGTGNSETPEGFGGADFVQSAVSAAPLSGSITLAWDAPESGNATSYIVEAGTAPGLSNVALFETATLRMSLYVSGIPAGI